MIDEDVHPVSIVVLAKDVRDAKTRMGLERESARELALCLAKRTIQTALDATSSGPVLVVTSDPAIGQCARGFGAVVVPEGRPVGMNLAAAMGREHALRASPLGPVAILVADLPRLQPQELDAVVDEFRTRRLPLYVADHHGEGTTLLIHGPHGRRGIAFGLNSAHMHSRLGYAPARSALPGLRIDLDTPEDLRATLSARSVERDRTTRARPFSARHVT